MKYFKTLLFSLACTLIVGCGSGSTTASNAFQIVGIQTLTAGQSVTVALDDTYAVPAGTTVRAPNGNVTNISGENGDFKVPRGSIITVSATASRVATNTVTGI
jgi:hypothetical protein